MNNNLSVKKTLLSFCAFLSVCGCMSRQTKLYAVKVEGKDGQTESKVCMEAGSELEYNVLGNSVNAISGCGTGLVNYGIYGFQEGWNESTNSIPVVGALFNGSYQAVRQGVSGMIEGTYEGWNATAAEVEAQNRETSKKLSEQYELLKQKSLNVLGLE